MVKKCEVDGCSNATYATGERVKRVVDPKRLVYCRKHCSWLDKYGTLEPPKFSHGPMNERFFKHVKKSGANDCWEWTADLSRAGYGSIWDSDKKKNASAHRFSYELHHGDIPDGLQVMHSCDNKKCVNPNHLSLGTPLQNTRDAVERGLRKPVPIKLGENNPRSKLTLEQVKFIKANPGIKHAELAKKFGLSPNCIIGVRTGRTWKHVT